MRRRKASRPGLAVALLSQVHAWGMPPADPRDPPAAGPQESRPPARWPVLLSNEGALDPTRLRFGRQEPVAAHILPPFWEPPHLQLCLSSYEGVLTLVVGTRENAVPLVARFLDALVDELPLSGRG